MCLLFICFCFIFYSSWTYNVAVAVPPVINNLPNTTTIHEDTSTAYALYILDVTDADGDIISSCSFGPGTTPGSGATKFDIQYISASTAWGIFTTTNGYDYSSQSSYTLEIDCDANGDTATGTYIVYLTQNQSPVINNLAASISVSTLTAAVGDTLFWVNGTDAENDQITFSITCDPATPACPFDIFDSGNLQLNAEILDTTVTGYDVTVDIADASGSGTSQTLTILFTDLNNPPQIENLGNTINVAENIALGSAIVTTSCKDNDVSDTLIYSMTCTPSTGSTYFQIDPSSGAITASSISLINYEYLLGAGTTSFTCTVTCGDGRTSDTANVDFDITDVNEKPAFSQTAYSISTNEGAGGTVIQATAFTVTEEDTSDTLTYSLDCGTISTGYFTIDTSTGIISFSTDYDVDSGARPTSVSCSVTVTDSGGLSDTSTVDVTISNINDNAPVFSQNSYVWFLAETDPVGTTVGTAAATDGDIGTFGTITYSLDQSTLTAEYFQIDQSGIVTLKTIHSAGVSPSFDVLATDGGGTETRVTATVVIIATTTITTTTSGDRYKTFFDDGRNIAWFTACCVILFITVIVTVWLCFIQKGVPSAYEYSKFRFRCCRFSEAEEPLTLHPRNWGEGHRNGF